MRSPADPLADLRGRNVLVIASTGGHLEQAVRWSARLRLGPGSRFVTFENEQSQSLLALKPHDFVPYMAPRDTVGLARALPRVFRLTRAHRFDAVLTTGAGLALAGYLPALLHRIPFFYIESVSRFEGASLTGNILARLPAARTFTQHASYGSRRWTVVDSLLADYQPESRDIPARPGTFFVSLGTIRPYRFEALVRGVVASLEPADRVTWQLGVTDGGELPGTVHKSVSATEFDDHATAADVVICHAGVGTILRLLELGISPIVVPRLHRRNEHVDDHQLQVASTLARLGLVTMIDAEALSSEVVHTARPSIRRSSTE